MNLKENDQLLALAEQYFQNNNYEPATAILKKIIETDLNNSKAYELLGYIESNQGNKEIAHNLLQRACMGEQASASAMYYLGDSFLERGQFQEAKKYFSESLTMAGDFFEGLHDLGTACASLGEKDNALSWYQRALKLKNDSPELFYNLGKIFDELKNYEKAIDAYDSAIRLKPDFAEAWFNKGCALNDLKYHTEAINAFDQLIKIQPQTLIDWDYGGMLSAIARACSWTDLERHKDAIIKITNLNKSTNPFAFFSLNDDALLHKKAAIHFVRAKFPLKDHLGPIPKRARSGKIRIGYFSADLHNHATTYLIAEMLELHNKDQFEIHAFSYGPNIYDEMRQRCMNAVDYFHDVKNHSDHEVAQLARNLQIDIAVDLKGFTQDGRMDIFALRAAPIQVSYLGYPGTTGAQYMDYIIADPILIPESRQSFYTEKIAYLPNSYQANDSKRAISNKAFLKAELGLPEKGFIFSCFNSNYKITSTTFDSWCNILNKVEGSVLWLFEDNPQAKENLIKAASLRKIDSKRLVFAGKLKNSEHLARQRVADLFLDTFPYTAHTTASDALWAGLPILTIAGDSFASRVSASLLTAIGLSDLITQTRAEYESLAVDLASNPEKLHQFRAQLQDNRLSKPLFDSGLFTRHIESAFAEMYQRYQDNLIPTHIYVKY